jgi:hypothetical protein
MAGTAAAAIALALGTDALIAVIALGMLMC